MPPAQVTFDVLNSNATVPEGTALPGGDSATVAVKVTGWPETGDAADEVRVVIVGLGEAAAAAPTTTHTAPAIAGTNEATITPLPLDILTAP